MAFQCLGTRSVHAEFTGGTITSDAWALLLGELGARLGIIRRFANCFTDHRDTDRIEHTTFELLAQRVFALCLGYEDLNDHDRLRRSNIDRSAGALDDLERIVSHLRRAWPEVEVVVRADSGFARDELMTWCEANVSAGRWRTASRSSSWTCSPTARRRGR